MPATIHIKIFLVIANYYLIIILSMDPSLILFMVDTFLNHTLICFCLMIPTMLVQCDFICEYICLGDVYKLIFSLVLFLWSK